ncbi:hypothetical protein [Erwinia amylovora]|uniref:hypothetical protein n=1 Tax=Erwinia amylovora TaxID=552 RepID=UPI003D091751
MDKKVYETHLTIPQPVLEKMLRPGVYKGDPGRLVERGQPGRAQLPRNAVSAVYAIRR